MEILGHLLRGLSRKLAIGLTVGLASHVTVTASNLDKLGRECGAGKSG